MKIQRFLKGFKMNDFVKLKYSGKAVDEGKMNAYDVASSIWAFGDFLGVLTRAVYGEKAKINTTIAGFTKGSFVIDFSLSFSLAINLFTERVNLLKDVIDLLKESISFFKHLSGLPPKIIQKEKNRYKIVNNQGQIGYFSNTVINVFTTKEVGEAAEQYVKKPLEKEGIDNLDIVISQEEFRITKNEAKSFLPIDLGIPLREWESEMGLTLISPVFVEGNKWKFDNGESTFHAEIMDLDFIKKVNDAEIRFGKGDIIIALVKTIQMSSFNKLKAERIILKVLEHRHGFHQENLFETTNQ